MPDEAQFSPSCPGQFARVSPNRDCDYWQKLTDPELHAHCQLHAMHTGTCDSVYDNDNDSHETPETPDRMVQQEGYQNTKTG